eukprot:223459_1
MALQPLNGTVSISILSILLMELTYFTLSSFCYIYYNPQYRVCWATFCCNRPAIVKAEVVGKEKVEGVQLRIADTEHVSTKKKAFIYYGMETISHCFILPTFLIFTAIYMSLRITMEIIGENDEWSKHVTFCQYVVRLRILFITIPSYLFLLFLCIPALKVEFMISISTKCQRMLPIITTIWIIITCIVHSAIQLTIQYDVKNGRCAKIRGLGTHHEAVTYDSIQYGICICLSFASFVFPLSVQKELLNNLLNNRNDQKIVELLTNINRISKRVCVFGMISCLSLVVINASFYIPYDPKHYYVTLSNLFTLYFIIWVNLYFAMIFIYDDWKIRLCPLCHYVRVCRCSKCHTMRNSKNKTAKKSSREKVSNVGDAEFSAINPMTSTKPSFMPTQPSFNTDDIIQQDEMDDERARLFALTTDLST